MKESSPVSRAMLPPQQAQGGDSLADVLERVLDKGVVISGDIRVNLLDIELLTIRIRLLISSADKAQELGMAWWSRDPFFSGEPESGRIGAEQDGKTYQGLLEENKALSRRLETLEALVGDACGSEKDDKG